MKTTITTPENTTSSSYDMIIDQLTKMQTYGRAGDKGSAKACLSAAKEIYALAVTHDAQVKANTEYFTTNFSHFGKMLA